MKFKKDLIFLCLCIFSFVLIGCEPITKDIERVEKVLMQLEENTAVDVDYIIDINTSGISMTIDSRVIMLQNGDKQTAYIEMGEGKTAIQMYYIDDYLCVISNGYYEVSETEGFTSDSSVPTDFNFDFDKLNYEISKETVDTNVIYTIIMDDADIKSLVEEVLGEDLGDTADLTFDMTLKLTVEKSTDKLQAMKISILYAQEAMSATIDIDMKINALGDNVKLDIPQAVTDKINEFKEKPNPDPDPDPDPNPDPDPDPNPDPDPDPDTLTYENTQDGVVKYFNLGLYKEIVYDKTTDKFAVLRNNSIDIYNAKTFILEKEITSLLTPYAIDADGGRMVVSYGVNQFRVYDLNTYEYILKQTQIQAYEIVIDGDTVIYADEDQWCEIIFHNLLTDTNYYRRSSVYQPLFTINRNDKILYVTETGLSSSELSYMDIRTGKVLYKSQFSQFEYVKDRVKYDGKYIHHEGKTFNCLYASVVSSTYLNRLYKPYTDFTAKETIYESTKISFVGSNTIQNKVAIYDNELDKFIYNFSLDYNKVIPLNNGFFLATTNSKDYVALVDMNKLDSNLVEELKVEIVDNTIVKSDDGKMQTLFSPKYDVSLTDDKYIYLLDKYSYEVNVYDKSTLARVFNKRFMMKPESIDAADGKMVIGLGNSNQFWIFDTSTWKYEVVSTVEPVFSTIIYNDNIYYAQIDQHCSVMTYNMTTKTHSSFGYSGYYISMAINREDGIIYFGDMKSSSSDLSYFNIETKQKIFTTSVNYSKSNVFFDGNFIHYNNSIYDKNGVTIANLHTAREYQNISNIYSIKTIFDNDTISVFSGIKNEEHITVIYDLTTNTHLYTLKVKALNANVQANNVIIFDNYEKVIQLNLN